MPTMPTSPIIVPTPGTTAPTNIVPVIPQQADPTYETVSVDTSYQPRASLLTYVEGANWTVDFYRTLIGGSNSVSPQQTDTPGAYQQYELIHNLLLKVTSALATSQDNTSKNMAMSGAATTLRGIIPNVGNEFVADIGDGQLGIFIVTSSQKMSLLTDSVYAIEYVLKDYATAELMQDLTAKVVRELTFVQDNLFVGMNPLIATSDMVILRQLKDKYRLLISQYFANFFSIEYQTLLVPNQVDATYDPFLVRAMYDWITSDENRYVPKIRVWNVDGDQALKMKTLWDSFNVMQLDYLPMACQQMGVTSITVADRHPYFESIFYSGMSQLVYPIDNRSDVDAQYVTYGLPAVSALTPGKPFSSDISRLIGTTSLDGFSYQVTGVATLPDILPVTVDEYYVFSKGFYQLTPVPGSILEQLALNALRGYPLDLAQLLRLVTNSTVWGNLERFYYTPVLIALLKTQIGAI